MLPVNFKVKFVIFDIIFNTTTLYKQNEHIQQKPKPVVATAFKKYLFNWAVLSTLLQHCRIFLEKLILFYH